PPPPHAPPFPYTTLFRSRVPPTESCFNRKATVWLSPIGSFTATRSTPASAPRASSARVNERPIRPKPLIPTRTATACPPDLLVRSEEHTSELQSRSDLVC